MKKDKAYLFLNRIENQNVAMGKEACVSIEKVRAEEKRKREEAEKARVEERRKREEVEKARAEERRKREEAEKARAEERRKREELETALAEEKRRRGELEKNLAEERRRREESEKALAEEKRKLEESEKAAAKPKARPTSPQGKNAKTVKPKYYSTDLYLLPDEAEAGKAINIKYRGTEFKYDIKEKLKDKEILQIKAKDKTASLTVTVHISNLQVWCDIDATHSGAVPFEKMPDSILNKYNNQNIFVKIIKTALSAALLCLSLEIIFLIVFLILFMIIAGVAENFFNLKIFDFLMDFLFSSWSEYIVLGIVVIYLLRILLDLPVKCRKCREEIARRKEMEK